MYREVRNVSKLLVTESERSTKFGWASLNRINCILLKQVMNMWFEFIGLKLYCNKKQSGYIKCG
jgi:hypothetical protein